MATARSGSGNFTEGPAPLLDRPSGELELSVVIPCLNEAETIEACIRKAQRAMHESGILGEVIVADNGSTDGAREAALELGARVVDVPVRGYGSALISGIAAARGRYILMGDADDSYDFLELPKFVAKLREGYDLVQGCRLEDGGGRVLPGAMPFLHRWVGNPIFSTLARWWFRAPIHDVNCGMRAFSRDHYRHLDQRCLGMEFAVEMIVKSSFADARIAEVPITLHPDGRRSHPPHLRTFRDGWRTLRFYLLYSPRWLFLVPGLILMALGAVAYGAAFGGAVLGTIGFESNAMVFASGALITGYQAMLFAVFAKVFAISEKLIPEDDRIRSLFRVFTLERGLLAGLVAFLGGAALLLTAVLIWRSRGYGAMTEADTMRWVLPGMTLTVLGVQTILSSFFLSLMGMRRQ
jgi:glycosyltransferase involved in cell wall biosynthesis